MPRLPTLSPQVGRGVRLGMSAIAGAWLAIALAGSEHATVGPFDTTVSLRPAKEGVTTVHLAPLGSIELDTHAAPVRLELRVDELRVEEAERIARDPDSLASLKDEITDDARNALTSIARRSLALAFIGGAIGALAISRRPRAALTGASIAGGVALVVGAATVTSFNAQAVAEPKYSGLLTVASTAVGDVEGVVSRFGEYQGQLTDLVRNVVVLYQAAQGLPTLDADKHAIRVLHVSDIHLNPQAYDLIELMVDKFDIDVIADTGDLTDWGSEPETQLVGRIRDLGVPYVWVRGNHDSESTAAAVAAEPNAMVLSYGAADAAGLRFWGAPDTRFTPNKDQPAGPEVERAQARAAAPQVAAELAADQPPAVDVVMVHDERMAARIAGRVPVVLAGHTHDRKAKVIGESTRLLVEGSTGGAGLRGLQGERPEPLTCTVLYFSREDRRLIAYDRVTVRGLGESGARIERTVLEPLPPTRPTGSSTSTSTTSVTSAP